MGISCASARGPELCSNLRSFPSFVAGFVEGSFGGFRVVWAY